MRISGTNTGLPWQPALARRRHTCIVWPHSGHRDLSPREARRWITCDENACRLYLSLRPIPNASPYSSAHEEFIGAHSRDAGPALHRYVFFSSPTPTSKRWVCPVIAPCHRSAPVFTLRSAFLAAFSVFARTSSPTFSFSELVVRFAGCTKLSSVRMRSSETWREFQNFLPLIRGRVTVLRGRRSSTLSVDKQYVDFRTILR